MCCCLLLFCSSYSWWYSLLPLIDQQVRDVHISVMPAFLCAYSKPWLGKILQKSNFSHQKVLRSKMALVANLISICKNWRYRKFYVCFSLFNLFFSLSWVTHQCLKEWDKHLFSSDIVFSSLELDLATASPSYLMLESAESSFACLCFPIDKNSNQFILDIVSTFSLFFLTLPFSLISSDIPRVRAVVCIQIPVTLKMGKTHTFVMLL